MSEQSQKTEKATPRRLQKAREEGNFPSARIFVSALQFMAFVAMLRSWGPTWVDAMHQSVGMLLEQSLRSRIDPAFLMAVAIQLAKKTFLPLAVLGGVLVLVTLAAQLLVTRFGLSLKKLTPDPKRLNPMARLKDLPRQNLPAAVQAAVMVPVFGYIVYALVRNDLEGFLTLPLKSVSVGAAHLGMSIQTLLWKASFLFLIFGTVDFFRQTRRYSQDLRMSRQEIRDEAKEVEGNPLMKMRLRRLRRDMARRRMMSQIATATAVVVNPTHYAVALKYDAGSTGAPMVVAKGKNYLALRIRKRALENNIPLIENPPLARALYKSVDVGQEIPAQFYRAVAEVLAYIYRLMNGQVPA